jgi:hypothetical protein
MNEMITNRYATLIAAVTLVLSWTAVVSADDRPMAFAPGEKLTFKLKWGIIPAGSATLEVQPMMVFNGVPTYHFVMKARTTPFIDAIYRYRNHINAYADQQLTHSLYYHKRTELGAKIREDKVHFDWETSEARFTRTGKYPGEKPEIQTEQRRIPLMLGAFDPLSIFYYTRQLDVGPGAPVERPVSDGRKCVLATAMILKRETIRVNGKDYDTYLVEPDLKHVGGVFEKSKDAKIQLWVTADKRRLPVKIKSRVYVGYFTAELVSAELTGEKTSENRQAQAAGSDY